MTRGEVWLLGGAKNVCLVKEQLYLYDIPKAVVHVIIVECICECVVE